MNAVDTLAPLGLQVLLLLGLVLLVAELVGTWRRRRARRAQAWADALQVLEDMRLRPPQR